MIFTSAIAFYFFIMYQDKQIQLLKSEYQCQKCKKEIAVLNDKCNLNKPVPFDNRIDEKTEKLIRLAANTSNEHEARSAALKVCQRLMTRIKP